MAGGLFPPPPADFWRSVEGGTLPSSKLEGMTEEGSGTLVSIRGIGGW